MLPLILLHRLALLGLSDLYCLLLRSILWILLHLLHCLDLSDPLHRLHRLPPSLRLFPGRLLLLRPYYPWLPLHLLGRSSH